MPVENSDIVYRKVAVAGEQFETLDVALGDAGNSRLSAIKHRIMRPA